MANQNYLLTLRTPSRLRVSAVKNFSPQRRKGAKFSQRIQSVFGHIFLCHAFWSAPMGIGKRRVAPRQIIIDGKIMLWREIEGVHFGSTNDRRHHFCNQRSIIPSNAMDILNLCTPISLHGQIRVRDRSGNPPTDLCEGHARVGRVVADSPAPPPARTSF